jgi:putative membrane protein
MNTFSTATFATVLATAVATVVVAQTPAPTSSSPSAASSPSQRQSMNNGTSEAPTTNGSDPSSASTPSQHQAMSSATRADTDAATAAGATPATFVQTAAQDGMTELALARLALRKSKSDDVKQFAQKMVQDHEQAGAQLASIAKSEGITFPQSLDAKHQAVIKNMRSMSPAAFDSAYATHMVKAHAQAVALFQSATNSTDPKLAAFAKQTLPTLEEHSQLAAKLQATTRTRTASAQ